MEQLPINSSRTERRVRGRGALAIVVAFIVPFFLALGGCGGGSSTNDSNGLNNSGDQGAGGSGGAGNSADTSFITWWRAYTDGTSSGILTRQASGAAEGVSMVIMGTNNEGSYRDQYSVADKGGDAFVKWGSGGGGSGITDGHLSFVDLYSAADILRQRTSPNYNYTTFPLKTLTLEGVWENIRMSHRGRYLAGAWAATVDRQTRGDADLTVIDLTLDESHAEKVYDAPGGVGEKVDIVQWVSDNQFMVRNRSGRKFLWSVETERYVELKQPPASFNGYSIVSETLAPDGMKYGGLMSRDGGVTLEAWISNTEYTQVRQLTRAGLKLDTFQWLGSSKLIKLNLGTTPTSANRCANAMVNTDAANALIAQQLQATPVPQNLPCAFEATAP